MVGAGLALFGVSVVAQGVQWSHNAWLAQDWFALGSGVAGGLIVLAGVGALTQEWRRYINCGSVRKSAIGAGNCSTATAWARGGLFVKNWHVRPNWIRPIQRWQRWHASLHETHNDGETVRLCAQLVQPVLDRQVRREISRHAAESALMIAVSPLALVDMAFITWRNLRLVNRIAAIYGIELGYF
ncbi:TIGR01620 family protein [Pantoea ananatis]